MGDIRAYAHLKHLQTALGLRLVCIWDSKAVCLKPEYTENCPANLGGNVRKPSGSFVLIQMAL